MTDVFVSYKRADETRVGRLVAALEKAGLTVWWDRSLPGAESWREGIAKALEEAKCTVVVWTQESTGHEGGFVRDEAGRAAKAGRLVPVNFDAVDPPLGFGELQSIDLTRWRGSGNDPFFQDLVAAIRAKIEGRAVPVPQGPIARVRRRIRSGSLVALSTALLAAFASNALNLQDRFCGMPLGQPYLADACGGLGLGASPDQEERLAWDRRIPGSCVDLRAHLTAFPKGALREQAQALLNARTVTVEQSWRSANSPMPLRIVQIKDGSAQPAQDLAKADALRLAEKKAEQMCKDFDATGLTRLKSAKVIAQEWTCDRTSGGAICGFEGQVLCWQDELVKLEREACGQTAAARP